MDAVKHHTFQPTNVNNAASGIMFMRPFPSFRLLESSGLIIFISTMLFAYTITCSEIRRAPIGCHAVLNARAWLSSSKCVEPEKSDVVVTLSKPPFGVGRVLQIEALKKLHARDVP